MDKVKYSSNATTAQNGQYPVTIQGLEFIQRQIMALQSLSFIAGDYYVIREPTASTNGVVVFNGEVLPLSGPQRPDGFICVTTTTETIHTNSGNYTDVREIRVAGYTVQKVGNEGRERRHFKEWRTNAELWAQLSELLRTGQGIPVVQGVFTRAELDARITTARLICLSGSAAVNDYDVYAVDVYQLDGDAAYQELVGPDFRRWGRYYTPATKTWGAFQPLSEQFTIEVKVTSTGVFFRHGFLPPYTNLVLLRKKTRSRKAGLNRPARPAKNAWYNSYKMEFSKGEPGKWYSPTCLAADVRFSHYIGWQFAPILRELLLIRENVNGYTTWRIAGVHRNWHKRPFGYAKIALGIVAGMHPNQPPLAMARLRFRVSQRNKYGYPVSSFTVD